MNYPTTCNPTSFKPTNTSIIVINKLNNKTNSNETFIIYNVTISVLLGCLFLFIVRFLFKKYFKSKKRNSFRNSINISNKIIEFMDMNEIYKRISSSKKSGNKSDICTSEKDKEFDKLTINEEILKKRNSTFYNADVFHNFNHANKNKISLNKEVFTENNDFTNDFTNDIEINENKLDYDSTKIVNKKTKRLYSIFGISSATIDS